MTAPRDLGQSRNSKSSDASSPIVLEEDSHWGEPHQWKTEGQEGRFGLSVGHGRGHLRTAFRGPLALSVTLPAGVFPIVMAFVSEPVLALTSFVLSFAGIRLVLPMLLRNGYDRIKEAREAAEECADLPPQSSSSRDREGTP